MLSGYLAARFGFGLPLLGALAFVWALIAAAFIDLDTTLLPDDITLPLLWPNMLATRKNEKKVRNTFIKRSF